MKNETQQKYIFNRWRSSLTLFEYPSSLWYMNFMESSLYNITLYEVYNFGLTHTWFRGISNQLQHSENTYTCHLPSSKIHSQFQNTKKKKKSDEPNSKYYFQ